VIEFWLVPDALWALVLAAACVAALHVNVSMSPLVAALLFAGSFVAIFLALWLALINCNPYPRGCTSYEQLRRMRLALPTELITRRTDLTALRYPRVFKPSLCSTNSSRVELIGSVEQARTYMAMTEEDIVLAQPFHPGEEYTIMWERWPWRQQGRVVAVCWRKKTHAPDEFHPLSGAGTPKMSIAADHLISPDLVRAMDETTRAIAGLYCTRLDVRADSAAELSRGRFAILESNGSVGVPSQRLAYALLVHWPKRMLIGGYNIFTHRNATIHPRILVERVRRFMTCGGWDFRICDGF
jgi:hypothetical protein